MKKLLLLFPLAIALSANAQVATFCNAGGNVIIYSNYDGGVLNIDVDQNIPNLKIGVVTYEPTTINITGTYAANVTEVRYAGYVSTTNHHCSNSPTTTTINGAGSATTSVNFVPAATYSNPNGYSMIICNYCSTTTNQGGCNTPDQIVDYFMTNFGGTLYYHYTQYGCWGSSYALSAGGNCCAVPSTLSVDELSVSPKMNAAADAANENLHITFSSMPMNGELQVMDLLGETIMTVPVSKDETVKDLSLAGMSNGIYILHFSNRNCTSDLKIVVH